MSMKVLFLGCELKLLSTTDVIEVSDVSTSYPWEGEGSPDVEGEVDEVVQEDPNVLDQVDSDVTEDDEPSLKEL